jgi:hypothetical protein
MKMNMNNERDWNERERENAVTVRERKWINGEEGEG